MPRRANELGVIGHAVSENLVLIRAIRGLTLRELADRLAGNEHNISFTALGQIEAKKKRVEVDDLFALALALQVDPSALLLPQAVRPTERFPVRVSTPRFPNVISVSSDDLVRYMHAYFPLWAAGDTNGALFREAQAECKILADPQSRNDLADVDDSPAALRAKFESMVRDRMTSDYGLEVEQAHAALEAIAADLRALANELKAGRDWALVKPDLIKLWKRFTTTSDAAVELYSTRINAPKQITELADRVNELARFTLPQRFFTEFGAQGAEALSPT